VVDLVLTMIFLEESLEQAHYLPPLGKRVTHLFSWIWQFTSSSRPTYLRKSYHTTQQADGDMREDSEDDVSDDEMPHLILQHAGEDLSSKDILNRDTLLLLITYLIFQLSNVSFNSLYPIFAQAQPPTGRSLNPDEIGLSLAFAGAVTILFQIGIFGKLRNKMGNRWAYRTGLGGFVLAFLAMPWVGYKDKSAGSNGVSIGKVGLWFEIGAVLLLKTVAAVGGLTSALLLVGHGASYIPPNLLTCPQITNSAPNHSVLGTLNGLAQTLSAAGRAAGPFLSGGLFSIAIGVRPKGEAVAFGVFGGIAFLGFLLSFGIRSPSLEAEGWEESDGDDDSDKSEEDEA